MTFGYFVPWRWENVIELEWRFVDLENRKILIPAEYTKSGKKPVKVALDGELLELLEDLQNKARHCVTLRVHQEWRSCPL